MAGTRHGPDSAAGGGAHRRRPQTGDPGSGLLFLSSDDVARIYDPAMAIESQRVAFAALGARTAVQPGKLMVGNPADGSVAFCYAARLSPHDGAVSKFGSVNPANTAGGLPSIAAVIVVLDPVTGRPAAIMDGAVITTRRTAAASAVAVEALSARDAACLAVLGCGTQGREHVRTLPRVRPIKAVRLWAPSAARRAAAARELAAETGLDVRACATAREAVAGAQIVALCTLSSDPLIESSWLAPGATVVSIGSIEPDRREVGADVVTGAARVVVDDPDTAAAHAGPIVDALRTGGLTRADLIGLGDVLAGKEPGRVRRDDLIYYNSTGLGVQDAAAATAVLARARRDGIGRRLSLTAS
jgi:ornithine cyclodeaminase/alanine dehydrogenase-like protein (mu-crystallin family)